MIDPQTRASLLGLSPSKLTPQQANDICSLLLLLDPSCGPTPRTPYGRMVAARTYLTLMLGPHSLSVSPPPLPCPPECRTRIYQAILRKEHLTRNHFLFRDIPELSSEGTTRPTHVTPSNFHATYTPDTLHPKRFACTLEFTLPPGTYGTTIARALFGKHL